jgi:Zn-dependent protease with chaperone function
MRALLAVFGAVLGVAFVLIVGTVRDQDESSRAVASERDGAERVQWVWARLIDAGWPESVPAPVLAYSARAWVHSQAGGEVIYGPHLHRATDDEIAFALAHELAHILLAHHVELKYVAHDSTALIRGVSRQAELEADARARHFMRRAGFDEWGIAAYFERHAPMVTAASMHPPHPQRLERLGLKP